MAPGVDWDGAKYIGNGLSMAFYASLRVYTTVKVIIKMDYYLLHEDQEAGE